MHIDRYERYWIIISAAVLGAFFASLVAGAFIFGIRLPSSPGDFVNPVGLSVTEFAEPGLRNMGDGQYTLHIVAHMWQFDLGSNETYADYFASQSSDPDFRYVSADAPNQVVRVPVGSEVTFIVTSQDVTHGFIIEHHNANIEVIPGHVGRQTVRFNRPGVFRMLCHEYCGQAHHSMHAMIVVE